MRLTKRTALALCMIAISSCTPDGSHGLEPPAGCAGDITFLDPALERVVRETILLHAKN